MVSLKSHRHNKNKNNNKNRSKRSKQFGGSVSSDAVVSLVSDNGIGTNDKVQGMQQDFMMEGQLPPKVLF